MFKHYLYVLVDSIAITSLTSDSPDGSTLILNWQPPDSPNGDILNYIVRITQHSDGVRISEQNVSNTTYMATSFSESNLYHFGADNINSTLLLQEKEFPTMLVSHQ